MNYYFNSSGTTEVSQNANSNTNNNTNASGGDVLPRLPSPQFRKSAPTPNGAGFQELYFPSTPQSESFPDYPVKSTKPVPASNNDKNEEVSQISQLSKEYNTNLDLVLSKPEFQRNIPMFYLQEVGAFNTEEVQAALRKKVDKETKAVYGPLDDAKVGEVFNTRSELYKVHADVVNDVCSNGDYSKPATSVIIYDGEEHDDRGNMVLFVGEKISYDAKATLDEPLLEGANLSLSRNSQLKIPIRLIRAARKTTSTKATNPFAPMSGYRYDGVYFVGEYWFEKSPFSQDWVYVFKFIRVYGQPTLGSFVHFPISRKDVSIDLALGNAGPPSMKTNAFPSWSEVFSKSGGDNNLISTYAPDESGKQKQKANNTNNTSDLLSLGGIYTTSNPVKEPVNTPNSFNKFMDNVTGFKMPEPQGQAQPANPYSLPSSYVNPSQFSTPYIPLPPTMASLNSSKPPSPPSAPQPPSSRPPAIAPKPSPMPPIAPMPQQQPPLPPQSRNAPIYPKPVPMQPNYSYPPVPQPQQHQPPAPQQYNPPQYMQMPPPPTPSLPSFGLPGSGRISDLKNVLSHDKIQDMLSSLRQKNSYQPRLDVPENIDALGRLPGGESSDPGNNSAVTSRNKQFFWNLGDPLLDKASMTKKSGKKRKQSISSATEESDYSSSGSTSASPSQAKKKQKKSHKRTEQQQQQQAPQQQATGGGSAPVDLTTSPQNPQ